MTNLPGSAASYCMGKRTWGMFNVPRPPLPKPCRLGTHIHIPFHLILSGNDPGVNPPIIDFPSMLRGMILARSWNRV